MRFLDKLSIQSKLLLMLLLISIASILTIGYIGYNSGKTALTSSIFNQLVSLRAGRAEEISSYFQVTENHVLTLSESPAIIDAMKGFKAAYQKINTVSLTSGQQQTIEKFYREDFIPGLSRNLSDGSTPLAETYLPQTAAQSYLQYHYIVSNPNPLDKKIALADALDGSEYSRVHQRFHPLVKSIVEKFGYYDFYLVDVDTGNIVYSALKEADFGSNLNLGPYASSNLANAVQAVRKSRDPNFVTSVDFDFYRASRNRPSSFIATTIFDKTDFIGALLIQIPDSRINQIMTSRGKWQQTGLGRTGETFLVEPDTSVRSVPRLFAENPDQYYKVLQARGVANDIIEQIKRLGTPILTQKVQTAAPQRAIAGETGTLSYTDYRGESVLSAFQPIKLGDFNWGLVAKMDQSEAFAPVDNFTRRLLIASAILVPLVTLLSTWLSRLFVRPIKRLIAGTRQIEAGATDVEVNIRSQDEFGELAHSFNQMAYSLHEKDQVIQTTLHENERLLLNVLPPPIAARLKSGEQQISDVFPNVTVLYAEIEGFNELSAELLPDQTITLLNDIVTAFDEAAEPFGVEKMRSMGNVYIAVCGLSISRVDHIKRTMDFAFEILKVIRRFNQQQKASLSLDIGIHSGSVVGGIVGKTRFIYALTGETMKIAHDIHSSPEQNIIQVTQPIYDNLHDLYPFERAADVEIKGLANVPVWSIKGQNFVPDLPTQDVPAQDVPAQDVQAIALSAGSSVNAKE